MLYSFKHWVSNYQKSFKFYSSAAELFLIDKNTTTAMTLVRLKKANRCRMWNWKMIDIGLFNIIFLINEAFSADVLALSPGLRENLISSPRGELSSTYYIIIIIMIISFSILPFRLNSRKILLRRWWCWDVDDENDAVDLEAEGILMFDNNKNNEIDEDVCWFCCLLKCVFMIILIWLKIGEDSRTCACVC